MRRFPAALVAASLAIVGTVALATSPAAGDPTPSLKISEFRLRGPNGENDEFIEITNVGPSHTVAATSGTGYAIAASDGVVRCVIPTGTVIPSGGHFLCTNSLGYSLSAYPAGSGGTATGDATYTTDIAGNTGIALFTTSFPAVFDYDTRIDAVGGTTEPNAFFREGAGYPALATFPINYSWYRNLSTPSITDAHIITSPTPGLPKDTDDNAADLVFVDSVGTSAGAGQRLGAPGPENSSSPVARGGIDIDPIDACVAEDAAPNVVRDTTQVGNGTSLFGTVAYDRTITNTTAQPITRLRLRITDIRIYASPPPLSDMRALTSTDGTSVIADQACGGGTTSVAVSGTTLEEPPAQQDHGGGFNSSWSVDAVTVATPLAAGDSINVRLLSGVFNTGDAAVRIMPEATTTAAYTPPELVCLGTTSLGGRNACIPPPPVVTSDPASDTVTAGETASFTAAATGSTSVRWDESPDGLAWTTITGEDETTLSFTADIADDGDQYRAVFVGGNAQETATAAATLTVITANTSFVQRAYGEVLGRTPEPDGVTYWAGRLDAGASRERVTDLIARQIEGRRKLVQDAYHAFLDRSAGPAGLEYWTGRLANGLTPEDLVVELASSAEARTAAGGTTTDLVELLYEAHLDRTGDQAGVAYWAGRIDAATTLTARRGVIRAFGRTAAVTAAAVRRAVVDTCGSGTPVPSDPAYGQFFASTGRDHVRLAGLVLARLCPVATES